MTTPLPQAAKDLLDAPEFATVATIEPDGRPHLSVIWVGRDGDDLLFSTTKGRRKTDNLERDGRATILVYPKENPYSYLEVRGTATLTDDPQAEYIDTMSLKYTGNPKYQWAEPGQERVIVRVTPDKVVWHG
jgi:PPOX class probable F420-dependent enzyme